MVEIETKNKKECSECGKHFESNDDSAYCSLECTYALNNI